MHTFGISRILTFNRADSGGVVRNGEAVYNVPRTRRLHDVDCDREASLPFRAKGNGNDKGITMTAGKTFTVSDGEMLLILEAAEEGGYVVTSPLDPELITEADSLDEAFQNARDAASVLNESRQKLAKQLAEAAHAS